MKKSAGILVYRKLPELEFFLVHPGGPFFKKKDLGWWTIPKGEINEGEDPLDAAKREFFEETGFQLTGLFEPLQPIKQKSGKQVFAWANCTDLNPDKIASNDFEMEWPPKSGKLQRFPEVDKAAWFNVDRARQKIMEAQVSFIDEVLAFCS